jgi:ABC-type multidrug transport system permease subunit
MSRLRDSSLYHLTRARVMEFAREPEAVFWTFFFPVIMAIALGIAFSGDEAAPMQVAVVAGQGADSLAGVLGATGRAEADVMSEDAAHDALRRGDVAVIVALQGDGTVRYRYDRVRDDSRHARLVIDDVLQRAAGRRDVRATSDEVITEKGSRYIDFLIPGLIGLNLLSTGLWFVGYTAVKMRTDRLLKRFATTPVRRSHFMLSFMLGRLAFLAGELAVVLTFARLAFDVPLRGSVLLVLFIAALGAFTFSGIGLLIASRARTIEGVQGLLNLVSVPMWVLSGVFFSARHFPDVMQPFIQALPLTALNNALRAVMLDGAGMIDIAGWLANLALWGIGTLAAAVVLFRWK